MHHKREIETAVRWWTDILRAPAKFNNGDSSLAGGLTQALAMIGSTEAAPLSEGQLGAFAKALTLQLEACIEVRDFLVFLGSDYGPDHELCRACEAAGIGLVSFRFPWKTQMSIRPGSVKVACGYGRPFQELLVEPWMEGADVRAAEERR